MGIKNYNDQLAQIKKAQSISKILKSYAQKTNAIIISLNEEWTGGDEKVLFLNALGECVRMSVDLANDYNTFYKNAKKWLDEMNDLDKITKALVDYRDYYLEPEKGERSGTGWIKVNTNTLLTYANKIQTNNASLREGYGMAKSLQVGIDQMITNRFTGCYSASRMKFRYEDLEKKNKGLAGKLRSVSEVFDKADRRIKVSITGEVDSDTAVGKVVAELSSTWKDALKDGKLTRTELESLKVALGESNLLKQIKKDANKYILDDYAFVSKAAEQLLEHEYGEAAETVGDGVVDLLFEGDKSLIGVKLKAVGETLKICLDEDGYIQKNADKYEEMALDSLKDGNILQTVTIMSGEFVQTVGKGSVDILCQLAGDAIGGIPVVGDALDYTNAVLEDLTGTSPELFLEEAGDTLSNGVDWFVDTAIDGAGHVDDFLGQCGTALGDVVVQGATGIGSGIKDLGNAITSLWKG